jgi:ferrous iron transport protein A
MTLRSCPPGRDVVVRRLVGTPAGRRRLLEWGFVPGATIRAVARGPAGGLIVAVQDARVALDATTAGSLVVEPVA